MQTLPIPHRQRAHTSIRILFSTQKMQCWPGMYAISSLPRPSRKPREIEARIGETNTYSVILLTS